MKVAKLDKATVDGLAGSDKPYVAWAGDLPGFGVAVRPNGLKSFIAQYDFGGRRGTTRRVTIGRYAEPWTVKQAHERAKAILDDAKRGIDYAEAKAKRRAELTVSELCVEYLEHGCEHKKASTIATDKGRIERHIKPLLGKLKVSDVGTKELEAFKRNVATGKGIDAYGLPVVRNPHAQMVARQLRTRPVSAARFEDRRKGSVAWRGGVENSY